MRVHIPQGRPDPEDYNSRRINGKQRLFGVWPGERKGELFDLWRKAPQASEELEAARNELKLNRALTTEGKRDALRALVPQFAMAKRAVGDKLAKHRAKLAAQAEAVIAETGKLSDPNSPLHGRLIERWQSMTSSERARMFSPSSLLANRELVAALVAEPAITSGIDSAQRQQLQQALLNEEQRGKLQQVDEQVRQLGTIERAYATAAETIAELCELTPGELAKLEEHVQPDPDPEPDPEPDPSKPKTFAQGAALELVDPATIEETA